MGRESLAARPPLPLIVTDASAERDATPFQCSTPEEAAARESLDAAAEGS